LVGATLIAIGVGVLPNATWDGVKAACAALRDQSAFDPERLFRDSLAVTIDSIAVEGREQGQNAEIAWAVADSVRNDEADPLGRALRQLEATDFSNLTLRLYEEEFRRALGDCILAEIAPAIPDPSSRGFVRAIVDAAVTTYREKIMAALDHDAMTRVIFEQALKIDLVLDRLGSGERSALEALPSDVVPFPFLRVEPLPVDALPAPEIERQVQNSLNAGLVPVVVGLAGSGKTTFSQMVASRYQAAYRVDIADAAGVISAQDVATAIKFLAQPKTLLIFDNIHASVQLAQAGVAAWRKAGFRPPLLLLSRPNATGAAPIDLAEPFRCLRLRPSAPAFANLADRVVKKTTGLKLDATFLASRAPVWRSEFAESPLRSRRAGGTEASLGDAGRRARSRQIRSAVFRRRAPTDTSPC
jgi:hypothetical protein